MYSEHLIVAPDKILTKTKVNGDTITLVKNAEKGFVLLPGGDIRYLTPNEISSLDEDCHIVPFLYYNEWGYEIKKINDKIINGKNAYGINIIRTNGDSFQLYFDMKSKLCIQKIDPSIEHIVTIRSYKKYEGIMYPSVSEIQFRDMPTTIYNTKDVEINCDFDSQIFVNNQY